VAVPAQRANPKLAAQTARRIEDDIIAAHWPVGQVLGSEAQLMERYDVSRAVLREAIRPSKSCAAACGKSKASRRI